MKDINSLEHTKWRCQYHIVFAPKYRRQVLYRAIKADVGFILRKLCEQKGVEIIEANVCPDHIHMILMETVSVFVPTAAMRIMWNVRTAVNFLMKAS